MGEDTLPLLSCEDSGEQGHDAPQEVAPKEAHQALSQESKVNASLPHLMCRAENNVWISVSCT